MFKKKKQTGENKMLTIKLLKRPRGDDGFPVHDGRFTTKIVEAVDVDIHVLRPNELYEISGTGAYVASNGNNYSFAFYVANDGTNTGEFKQRPEGFAKEVEFWSSAYIENAAGKTTEVVRF
jgi:hypothetical protein